ncbi:MAG: hypothetical protein C4334_01105 [Pyrinomonas sp.]
MRRAPPLMLRTSAKRVKRPKPLSMPRDEPCSSSPLRGSKTFFLLAPVAIFSETNAPLPARGGTFSPAWT